MGVKKLLKNSIQQLIDAISSLSKVTRQNKQAEKDHYDSIMKQLNDLEKKSGKSIKHINNQLDRLTSVVAKDAGIDSLDDLSPTVHSLNQELSAQQEELAQYLEKLREMIAPLPMDVLSQQPELADHLKDLSTSVSRHNMVIEDLLESMEETFEDQQNMLDEVKNVMRLENKAELSTLKADNKSLLTLIQCYQDQLCVLEAAAKDDPAWSHQFDLVRQKMTTPLQKAGITLVDQTNVPVSYDLHEVIDRVDTDDPMLRFCVAEVYKPGFLFKDKVLRKAEISAFAPPADEETGMDPMDFLDPGDDEVAPDIPEVSADAQAAGIDKSLTDEADDEIVLPDAQAVVDALTGTEDDADSTEEDEADEAAGETVPSDAQAVVDILTGAEEDADSTEEDETDEETLMEENAGEAVLPDAQAVADVLTGAEEDADSTEEEDADEETLTDETAGEAVLPDAQAVVDALTGSEDEETDPAAAGVEAVLSEGTGDEAVLPDAESIINEAADAETALNDGAEDAAGVEAEIAGTEEPLTDAEGIEAILPDAAADAGEVTNAGTDETGETEGDSDDADSDDPESAAETMMNFVPGAEVLPDPETVIKEMMDPDNDDDPLGLDPTVPDPFGF